MARNVGHDAQESGIECHDKLGRGVVETAEAATLKIGRVMKGGASNVKAMLAQRGNVLRIVMRR